MDYKHFLATLYSKITERFVIHREESDHETLADITAAIEVRGTNLWMLSLATIIACIGLNINSKYAIIGAMIISPLMGPIYGMVFGLAIRKLKLVKIAFFNWLVIFSIALVSSFIYFMLTPLYIATDEILSFSHPTVFDILLALFGGMAGFLAITRKNGVQVLSGVAVATSCIPPICAASYGLSNGSLDVFAGGVYCYLINCFFIFLGSYILSVVLKYNTLSFQDRKSIGMGILVVFIFILPGLYMSYTTFKKTILDYNIQQYIDHEYSSNDGLYFINKEINYEDRVIDIFYSGQLPEAKKSRETLAKYHLENCTVFTHEMEEK